MKGFIGILIIILGVFAWKEDGGRLVCINVWPILGSTCPMVLNPELLV
jgi:hypothetical protein